MKRTLVILFIALLSISASYAQNYISIKGKVVDNNSSNALPRASINLIGSYTSIVSNSEGFFTLKIPADTPPDAVIAISSPGYLTSEYPVSEFIGLESDIYLRVPLLPFNLSLDPAATNAVNPEVLLNSAYAMVSRNYASEPVGMTAFYTETVKKGNTKHIILDEAVLDIEKSSYTDDSCDKVSVRKGRGNLNREETDPLFSQYQGGLAAALSLDMVKNPFIGTTLPSAPLFYDFYIDGLVSIDGKTFYIVGFKPKKDIEPILFTGKVYIEEESLAIGRLEFSMDIGDKKVEAAGEFILKRPSDTEFSINRAEYLVTFKEFDGQWHLNYCKADIGFSARKKNSLLKSNYSITSEMVITDHKEGEFHISNDQKGQYRQILSDDVTSFSDKTFWQDDNVIEQNASVEQMVRRILSQLSKK